MDTKVLIGDLVWAVEKIGITPNYLLKNRYNTILTAFSYEGYRIIKSHFFARHHNLDWLWENMKGDYIILLYKEPQASFAWWCNVMDFSEDWQ